MPDECHGAFSFSALPARGEQGCGGEAQLTTAEVEHPSFLAFERSLNGRRDAITDLFAVPVSLHQSGIAKDTEMVRRVRLRAAQLPRELTHALFPREKEFQDSQARFVAHGLQDCGTLARGREVTDRRLRHQQQFPSGEQLTASPFTAAEVRW